MSDFINALLIVCLWVGVIVSFVLYALISERLFKLRRETAWERTRKARLRQTQMPCPHCSKGIPRHMLEADEVALDEKQMEQFYHRELDKYKEQVEGLEIEVERLRGTNADTPTFCPPGGKTWVSECCHKACLYSTCEELHMCLGCEQPTERVLMSNEELNSG